MDPEDGCALAPRGQAAYHDAVRTMDEHEYLQRADACLEAVARWLEGFDPDEVDFATTDGVVTLEFPDGVKFVLNRQAGASQMWFAAGARAWHYDWDAASARWVDDRDGHALFAKLGAVVSEKLGRTVHV
jgi:CyaY protein